MGYYMREKKKHPVLIVFLWICFIAAIGIVAYLSFQNGAQAKALGRRFIQYVADRRYSGRKATDEEMLNLTYEIRQAGRMVAFFLIGIWGTMTIHVSFRKCSWVLKTGITAMLLLAVAYLTEKLKIYIPSRHYSYEEMMLSIAAVSMGFLMVSVIILCFHILKGFFRFLETAVH